MAVLPSSPSLKVEVYVGGKALQEYEDHQDAPLKTITKYIEAVPDTYFHITWSFTKNIPAQYEGIRVLCAVDGEKARGSIIERDELWCTEAYIFRGRRGHIDGEPHESPFTFANIQVGTWT